MPFYLDLLLRKFLTLLKVTYFYYIFGEADSTSIILAKNLTYYEYLTRHLFF